MNSDVLVSVAMPVYNAADFLDDSISSILNQSFQDFEFLIIDDGSTDESWKIIQRYAEKDSRIKIFQNDKNKRHAICRNFLLERARGEFLAWMDADDISSSKRLEMQIHFLKKYPEIDILGTNVQFFGTSSGQSFNHCNDYEIKTAMLLGNEIFMPSSIMRLSKIKENKVLFNENLSSATDFRFWIDCLPFCKFGILKKTLAKYRTHSSQESVMNREKQLESHIQIVNEHLEKFEINSPKLLEIHFRNKISFKDLQQISTLLHQILKIENYYHYQKPEKLLLLKSFFFHYKKFGKKGMIEFIKAIGIFSYLKLLYRQLGRRIASTFYLRKNKYIS